MEAHFGILITLIALMAGLIGAIVAILAMPDVCESLTPVSDNPNGITLEQLSKELLEALGYQPDSPMAYYVRKAIQDYFLKRYR